MRRSLKDTRLHWMLGERIFHSHLWAVNTSAVAGGLSLGLFVAFTPTIPFQMLLCTFGALLFRVNLPIALIACWVTNPLTAFPIYMAGRRLGKLIFDHTPVLLAALDMFRLEGRGRKIIEESTYVWTGCLVFSLTASLVGNALTRLAAVILRHLVKSGIQNKSAR
ncbi:MAG: DUF2062 domain-containing protein [Lentisphaeria bacterium]|nr:DUF2062 domain-containing protein [Lentisphaeria bacterium]